MNVNDAGQSEMRRHSATAEAARAHLVRTDAQAAYYEAWFDILWVYGEHAPFEAACDAARDGDRVAMERALADDGRLAALARATR